MRNTKPIHTRLGSAGGSAGALAGAIFAELVEAMESGVVVPDNTVARMLATLAGTAVDEEGTVVAVSDAMGEDDAAVLILPVVTLLLAAASSAAGRCRRGEPASGAALLLLLPDAAIAPAAAADEVPVFLVSSFSFIFSMFSKTPTVGWCHGRR